jgi:hypothetical protein
MSKKTLIELIEEWEKEKALLLRGEEKKLLKSNMRQKTYCSRKDRAIGR